MKKLTLFLLVSLSSPGIFSAECTQSGCISTISTLYTNTEGLVYVGTPEDETKAECTPVSGTFLRLIPMLKTLIKYILVY